MKLVIVIKLFFLSNKVMFGSLGIAINSSKNKTELNINNKL